MHNSKVLYVEDNKDNQKLVQILLEKESIELLIAENDKDALKMVKEAKPDLILMDLNLPSLSLTGFELTTKFKSIDGINNIPIIALTARCTEEDKRLAFAAGCIDFWTKPINPVNFVNDVKKYIEISSNDELVDSEKVTNDNNLHDVTLLKNYNRFLVSRLEERLEELKAKNKLLEGNNEKLNKLNSELKKIDKLKTSILANITHELRTPLVSIRGYTESMINEILGPMNPTQKEALFSVVKSTDRLQKLINSILDLAKMEDDKTAIKKSDISLNDLFYEILKILKYNIEEKNITVEINNSIESIFTDRNKFFKIVFNIFENAVKFNKTNGKLIVDTFLTEDKFMISISDTGIGIAEDEQDKIFNRFYQIDSSYTRLYSGAGMGLALTKRYVKLLKGSVFVESKPNEGSTFKVTIPIIQKKNKIGSSNSNRNVLLIEDEIEIVKLVKIILETNNYNFYSKTDCKNILKFIDKNSINIIIIDLQDNKKKVIDVCEVIRNSRNFNTLPIICILPDKDAISVDEKEKYSIASYVTKPFKINELLNELNKINLV